MPRLIKYNTTGLIDDVPDPALQVIEHTTLFYFVDKNFKGVNKFVVFAGLGAMYEYYIAGVKKSSAPSGYSSKKDNAI